MPNMSPYTPSTITTAGVGAMVNPARTANAPLQAMQGYMQGEQIANQRHDRQVAVQDKENAARLAGYKAILADPKNANAIAQMHGIPMTETLQGLLQQPMMLQNVVMAQEFADKMGIKNPKAINAMMLEAAGQAMKGQQFNPTMLSQSIQGMDTTEPMNEYQRGQLDVSRQNAATNAQYKDVMADYYRTQGNTNATRYVKPWENPALPPELQMEGAGLAKQYEEGMPDEAALAAWKAKADPYLNPKVPGQGGAMPGQPAGGAPGQPPAPMKYQELWGD